MDGLRKVIKLHCRRIALEIINFLINHDCIFWLLGQFNRRFSLLESIHLTYPANMEYALAYGYQFRIKKNHWNPWLTGFLFQNKKMSVMFCISASENQFVNRENLENLKLVNCRLETIRQLLGVGRKTFGGVLPGILYIKRIIREVPEADMTAAVLVKAILAVKHRELLDDDTPIVVLGGRGFIGRRVIKLLDGVNIYNFDLANGQEKQDWPLTEKRMIVLNVTRNRVISEYLNVVRPGTIIIDDVYPEPSPEVLEEFRVRNCPYYYLVGVKGITLPSLPSVYKGAVLCCAAWPSPEMEVVIRKIN